LGGRVEAAVVGAVTRFTAEIMAILRGSVATTPFSRSNPPY
jgi:hypothetical protein